MAAPTGTRIERLRFRKSWRTIDFASSPYARDEVTQPETKKGRKMIARNTAIHEAFVNAAEQRTGPDSYFRTTLVYEALLDDPRFEFMSRGYVRAILRRFVRDNYEPGVNGAKPTTQPTLISDKLDFDERLEALETRMSRLEATVEGGL